MTIIQNIACSKCHSAIEPKEGEARVDLFQIVMALHFVNGEGMGKKLIVELCEKCKLDYIMQFTEMGGKESFEVMQ